MNIIGDGNQSTNAVARALVNSLASNSVYRIEMLNRGLGYTHHTANVLANSVVNVTSNSILRPIYSPLEGHGSDAAEELGAKRLSVAVQIASSESDTVTIDNRFQQIGLLKDPLFANVSINVTATNGEFATPEQFYKITPVRLNTAATTNATATTVTCATAAFDEQVAAGDMLYLKSGNGTLHQLVSVSSVTNSTSLELSEGAAFSCTATIIYYANTSSEGYVEFANTTLIRAGNVSGQLLTNDTLIGV